MKPIFSLLTSIFAAIALISCSDEAGPLNDQEMEFSTDTVSATETPTEKPTSSEPSTDATDSANDSESSTQGLSSATPAAPCEDDLDALNGHAEIDLGEPCASGTVDLNPGEMGPYHEAITNYTISNPFPSRKALAVTIYAPSVNYKDPLDGPMPLIVLLPGFSGKHNEYVHYSHHFASWGFAVVGIEFGDGDLLTDWLGGHDLVNQDKNAQEVVAVLDWALNDSPLSGHLDEEKIAVCGHSLGGKIGFFAASMDDRIDLVIGWDPQNAGGGAPCMINPSGCNDFPVAPNCQAEDPGLLYLMHAETLVFASRDAMILPDRHTWAEHFYRGAPSPASLVLTPSAQHTDWGQSDNNEIVRIAKRTQMALLLTRFKNVKGLEKYLPDGTDLDNYPVVVKHSTK